MRRLASLKKAGVLGDIINARAFASGPAISSPIPANKKQYPDYRKQIKPRYKEKEAYDYSFLIAPPKRVLPTNTSTLLSDAVTKRPEYITRFDKTVPDPSGATSESVAKEVPFLMQPGKINILYINRPYEYNKFDLGVVLQLTEYVKKYSAESGAFGTILRGSGEKSFSIGTDFEELARLKSGGEKDKQLATLYNQKIHSLCFLIGTTERAIIPLMNGLTLGSAASFALNAPFACTSTKAILAFPETSVGLVPHGGVRHILARTPNHIGVWLALTGSRIEGYNIKRSGLSLFSMDLRNLTNLQDSMRDMRANELQMARIISMMSVNAAETEPYALENHVENIDRCFGQETLEKVKEELEKCGEWGRTTLKQLNAKCPTALEVAFRALQKAKTQNFVECVEEDYRIMERLMQREEFINHATREKWQEVNPQEVEEILKPFKNSTNELRGHCDLVKNELEQIQRENERKKHGILPEEMDDENLNFFNEKDIAEYKKVVAQQSDHSQWLKKNMKELYALENALLNSNDTVEKFARNIQEIPHTEPKLRQKHTFALERAKEEFSTLLDKYESLAKEIYTRANEIRKENTYDTDTTVKTSSASTASGKPQQATNTDYNKFMDEITKTSSAIPSNVLYKDPQLEHLCRAIILDISPILNPEQEEKGNSKEELDNVDSLTEKIITEKVKKNMQKSFGAAHKDLGLGFGAHDYLSQHDVGMFAEFFDPIHRIIREGPLMRQYMAEETDPHRANPTLLPNKDGVKRSHGFLEFTDPTVLHEVALNSIIHSGGMQDFKDLLKETLVADDDSDLRAFKQTVSPRITALMVRTLQRQSAQMGDSEILYHWHNTIDIGPQRITYEQDSTDILEPAHDNIIVDQHVMKRLRKGETDPEYLF